MRSELFMIVKNKFDLQWCIRASSEDIAYYQSNTQHRDIACIQILNQLWLQTQFWPYNVH